jgi:Cu(I)/Ag(I) efflux system membrane fusion protein
VVPVLDTKRRVVQVRVDLPNEQGRLKPGTFLDAHIMVALTGDGRVHDPNAFGAPGEVLVVPRTAVLDGGDRKLVYVMIQEPGTTDEGEERWPAIYEPREVRTGLRVDDGLVLLSGLDEGDAVVTRGQFLIDSQLQLTGKPSLMIPEAAAAPIDPHAGHRR